MLTLILVATLAAAPQSLGDLAKATAAARDKAKADGKAQPAKVWTDADLKSIEATLPKPSTPAPENTAPAKDTPAVAEQRAVAADAKQDEATWRARFSPVWTQLDFDGAQLIAASTRVRNYRAAMDNSQRSVNGEIYVDRMLKQQYLDAVNEESRLTAAVAAGRRQLSDLEEDARRANVPPGWYRRR